MPVMIGDDFEDTTAQIWCPTCGEDGNYTTEMARDTALYHKRVPAYAECPNKDCRTHWFRTED